MNAILLWISNLVLKIQFLYPQPDLTNFPLRMKIITWNCNMAFRKKTTLILKHKPDILVIPECEHPDNLAFLKPPLQPNDILWFGHNRHKGLAILSYSHYRFTVLENHNNAFQLIVPIAVTGGEFDFILFAIWANNPNDPDGQYVEQIWKAIDHYEHLLAEHQSIWIGDFNSNTIWDRKRRVSNHSNVVSRLETKGIVSTYHQHHRQIQGKEKHPTLYLYRHKDKPYHIDYCFVSKDWAARLKSVEVGRHKYWTQYSDHVPVFIDFD